MNKLFINHWLRRLKKDIVYKGIRTYVYIYSPKTKIIRNTFAKFSKEKRFIFKYQMNFLKKLKEQGLISWGYDCPNGYTNNINEIKLLLKKGSFGEAFWEFNNLGSGKFCYQSIGDLTITDKGQKVLDGNISFWDNLFIQTISGSIAGFLGGILSVIVLRYLNKGI